jgi:hypothetical protein
MQVLKTYYNDSQMTDTNSLVNALLERPEELSPIITHLAGKEDRKFPLTMLTEGVGNTKSIDRWEYEYRVKTHTVHTRPCAAAAVGNGIGGSVFTLTFPDKWFIFPYTLISNLGTQARIMAEPLQTGSNYEYTMQLIDPDPTAVIAATEGAIGAIWGQLYANVGVDFSRGNASNWSTQVWLETKLVPLENLITSQEMLRTTLLNLHFLLKVTKLPKCGWTMKSIYICFLLKKNVKCFTGTVKKLMEIME